MMRLLHFGGRNWVRYGTCTDQGGFLLRRIIKDLLTHRRHACLMCAAQVTPLKAAFPIFIQYPWHSIPTVQVGQHQSTSKAGRSYPKWPSPSYTKASHAYSSLPAAGYCGTCGWGRERESLDPVVLGIASELFFLMRRNFVFGQLKMIRMIRSIKKLIIGHVLLSLSLAISNLI